MNDTDLDELKKKMYTFCKNNIELLIIIPVDINIK